ncbi:1-deoxy-D-xylulose-5-phosphate synthase N-terminal domain-containing protein, partial [Methylomonas koyamae]|uniref:1-deoxy-D-xylulose-5-phosphate synthase N-terminal domain-containing protein n=1 Tax=Methylomonas koyamae TaxID=702114 RepID=UPI000A6900EB
MKQTQEFPLLNTIARPADIRALKKEQLPQLADEVRSYLTHTVSISGGHFAAG